MLLPVPVPALLSFERTSPPLPLLVDDDGSLNFSRLLNLLVAVHDLLELGLQSLGSAVEEAQLYLFDGVELDPEDILGVAEHFGALGDRFTKELERGTCLVDVLFLLASEVGI